MSTAVTPVSDDRRPLTSVEEAPAGWLGLPRATLLAWRVESLLGLLCFAVLLGASALSGRPHLIQAWLAPVAVVAALTTVLEIALLVPRRHHAYRYRCDRDLVEIHSGVLLRRDLLVPLHQVLYVELKQGPVLRACGLVRLRLGTIADPLDVGPLSSAAATSLRGLVERPQTVPAAVQSAGGEPGEG